MFLCVCRQESNDMQIKLNSPSPSLDKSRSFKEEVCLVGKADMYRGGCKCLFTPGGANIISGLKATDFFVRKFLWPCEL